jgi:hypothetical protein
MRQTGLAAILFVAVSTGAAHAELFDALDWCRRVEALARSLIDGHLADREIVKPPGNIDPQMVLVPPQARGTARIIIPPGEPGR